MKLLFALLVVSALMLKVEGDDKVYNEACVAGTDTCTTANTECKSDGCGATKCLCSANYVYDTACKLVGGQACKEATKTNCVSGKCTDSKCEGTVANGAACAKNSDCISLNCQLDGTDKCAAQAASDTVVASLTLMLMTFVTTRFL